MGNKADLQQNNIDLSSIKAIAEGLPLEQVIKALASTGQYAWKKYQKTTYTNPSFKGTITSASALQISDEDFDVNLIDDYKLFFDEFTDTVITSDKPKITRYNNSLQLYMGGMAYVEITGFDKSSKTFTLGTASVTPTKGTTYNFALSGSREFSNLLGITVDNSPTAYPDGGVQDGYYYERVVEGLKTAHGTITLSSSSGSLEINHGMGVEPQYFMVKRESGSGYNPTIWGAYPNGNSTYGGAVIGRSNTYNEVTPVITQEKILLSVGTANNWGAGTYDWISIA